MSDNSWLDWTVELQSLAQAGLFYGRDAFDLERYERIRAIAAEMMAALTDVPVTKVRDLFCNETGTRRPSSIRGPPSSTTIAFSSSARTTASGRCPAAGAT